MLAGRGLLEQFAIRAEAIARLASIAAEAALKYAARVACSAAESVQSGGRLS